LHPCRCPNPKRRPDTIRYPHYRAIKPVHQRKRQVPYRSHICLWYTCKLHNSGQRKNANTKPCTRANSQRGSFHKENHDVRNWTTHDGITCFNCNNMGHISSNCPKEQTGPSTTGTTLMQVAFVLAQAHAPGLHKEWILLDSQSTVLVFKNASMLTNIRRSPHVLRAMTNGGHQDSTFHGNFPNLGSVWYNSKSLANILSLSKVRKVCCVNMDTGNENAMCVHQLDGSIMKFVKHDSGLYVFLPNTNDTVTGYNLVSTIGENKRMFTQRKIRDADTAGELYRKLGRPSEAEFQSLLRRNLIRNCTVTPDDARRALLIHGPDIAALKGKTVKEAPASRTTPRFSAFPIPAPVLLHHRNVTLCIDLFFTLSPVIFVSAPFHFLDRAPSSPPLFSIHCPWPHRTRCPLRQRVRMPSQQSAPH
jgi:hypothetical protein